MPHLPIPLAFASYENIRKPLAQKIQTKVYQLTQALGSATRSQTLAQVIGSLRL
ncbi:MAG: hypothetical protein ACREN8_08785 [Candidatus Dormibacteraceae bacterium]